jgi:hypothetical protein
MCQRDDAEGDEVRPITFDPVTPNADPLTNFALCCFSGGIFWNGDRLLQKSAPSLRHEESRLAQTTRTRWPK